MDWPVDGYYPLAGGLETPENPRSGFLWHGISWLGWHQEFATALLICLSKVRAWVLPFSPSGRSLLKCSILGSFLCFFLHTCHVHTAYLSSKHMYVTLMLLFIDLYVYVVILSGDIQPANRHQLWMTFKYIQILSDADCRSERSLDYVRLPEGTTAFISFKVLLTQFMIISWTPNDDQLQETLFREITRQPGVFFRHALHRQWPRPKRGNPMPSNVT